MQSVCECCNVTFEHSTGNHRRFCSTECRNATPFEPVGDLFCVQCGDEITKDKRKGKKFCCRKCFGTWQSENKVGEAHPSFSKIERVCENCSCTFSSAPSEIEKGWARYCSQDCKKEHGRAYCTCWQCEEGFHTIMAQVMNGGGKFCSRKCKDAWLKDHPPTHQLPVMCGADHPNYRGGYKGNYYGPNWRKQQRKVRKRAGYRCECCGKTQKQNKIALDVHHVKSFRSFGYIPDVNDHFLAANRLDNLIAVCRSCHMKIEMGSLPIQPYLL